MNLTTSGDILNWSLAISVFGLAFLLGWILVYVIIAVRSMVKLLSSIEERMKKIDDFMTMIKEKVEHSSTYLSVLAMGLKELISYFISKREAKSKKKASSL